VEILHVIPDVNIFQSEFRNSIAIDVSKCIASFSDLLLILNDKIKNIAATTYYLTIGSAGIVTVPFCAVFKLPVYAVASSV
jgi:hypothetical protein